VKRSSVKRSGVKRSNRIPQRRRSLVGLHSLRELVRTLYLCAPFLTARRSQPVDGAARPPA
jgi:hypothetical protein